MRRNVSKGSPTDMPTLFGEEGPAPWVSDGEGTPKAPQVPQAPAGAGKGAEGLPTVRSREERDFPVLTICGEEILRLTNELRLLSGKEKGSGRWRELKRRIREEEKRARDLRGAIPLLGEVKRILYGPQLELGSEVARETVLAALPQACAREGVEVRFEGVPETDGRTVYLGAVDFSHPLSHVYAWGHGLHERNHVVHTDFAVFRRLRGAVRRFANLFEDIRVDKLGIAEMAGYRLWREALFRVVDRMPGHCVWSVTADSHPGEILLGWLYAHLEEEVLGLELPKGARSGAQAAFRAVFGEGLLERLRRLLQSRFPLASSDAAAELAGEVAEILWSEAETSERNAEERFGAGFGERLFALPVARVAQVRRRWGETGEPSAEPEPTLFGADGRATPAAAAVLSDEEREALRIRAVREAADLSDDAPDRREEGVRTLSRMVRRPQGVLTRKREGELLAEALDVGREAAERLARGLNLKLTFEREVWPKHPASGGEHKGVRAAARLAWSANRRAGPLAALLADTLRRPVTLPFSTAEDGWDVDDAVLDRLPVGDPRVFVREGRERGLSVACVILADLSGSVSIEESAAVKVCAWRLEEAMKRLPGLAARTAVFPARYGAGALPVSDWEGAAEETFLRLLPIPPRGGTPLPEAIRWAASALATRTEERRIVLTLTDGMFEGRGIAEDLAFLDAVGMECAILKLSAAEPLGEADGRYGCPCEVVRDEKDAPLGLKRLLGRIVGR